MAGAGSIGVGAATAAPLTCTPNVDNSGLTAAVVASPGQTIANQTIDATGCDIGIYVGKGVAHVRITSVTVENASFQGIFAQDTSHVTIEHSTVTNNAFGTLSTDPNAPKLPSGVHSYVSQSFAISLFGVSHSTVSDNTVYNNGRGGIGIMDNGTNDPGTLNQPSSAPLVSSSHDTVSGNQEWANYNGCAVVAATQNFGGSLSHLVIADNAIAGTQTNFGEIGANGADVGGIVVAADPPQSSVSHVDVSGNHVTDSFEGGVIVNAEAFNSFTDHVHVIGNTVSGNNWGDQEAPGTAGIIVYANPGALAQAPPGAIAPANIGTVVVGNTAADQFYGIWSTGDYPPTVAGNQIEVVPGGIPIATA
ncbi:MAG: hypothetical protein ACRDNS_00275 [Trebonia sp.]